jgi:hypothetical protein
VRPIPHVGLPIARSSLFSLEGSHKNYACEDKQGGGNFEWDAQKSLRARVVRCSESREMAEKEKAADRSAALNALGFGGRYSPMLTVAKGP